MAVSDTDRRFDLGRVVDTIAQHHPDVVALQEVDSRRTVAAGGSPFAVLREAVGDHGIEAKSITTADGEYGQMVVSRWPFNSTRIHDITHAKREPRRAIEVEISAPGGTFRLVAAHFGLSLSERRRQARRLVAIARQHTMTTVMLGDFNEWFWPASLRGALGRELPARTRIRDIPFLVSAPAPGPDFLLAARSDAGELRRPRRPSCIRPPPGGG